MNPLFKSRVETEPTDEPAVSKEEFIKGAATVHRDSSVIESKPVSRKEKLLAELAEIEKEMTELWDNERKTPKAKVESFSNLPNVVKKLDIMYEDVRGNYSSKSKFISAMIEEKFEEWLKGSQM